MPRPGKRRLTRERIVGAALALADDEGLEALSMRRLARDLEVDPMSLYNHVSSKGDLMEGVVELLIQQAQLPTEAIPWDQWARTSAQRLRDLSQAHPRAFPVLALHGISAGEVLRPFEAFVDSLVRAGFPIEMCWELVQAFVGFTVAFALAAVEPAMFPEATVGARTTVPDLSAEFPRLREMTALSPPPRHIAVFNAGLELIIEGMRVRLRQARRQRPR